MSDVKIRVVTDRGLKATCLAEVYINDFKVPGLSTGTKAEVVLNHDLHETVLTLRFTGNRLEIEEITPDRREQILGAREAELARIETLPLGTSIDSRPDALEQ